MANGKIVCPGTKSIPHVPNAISGTIEGWDSEWVDGKIWLCGGANINQVADCFKLDLAQGYWEMVKQDTFPCDSDYTIVSPQASEECPYAFEYAASLVFNDQFVVMGGYNDRNGWIDTVGRKQKNSDKWDVMGTWKLPYPMYDLCASQVDSTHIIVTG